ncbi:MAG: hypothetical protein ACFBSF_12870 [Leptolyngbyaceae cyanobacterium]
MSEKTVSFTVAGVELCANEEEKRAVPTWLGEALLVGHYWQSSGLQNRANFGLMATFDTGGEILLNLLWAPLA